MSSGIPLASRVRYRRRVGTAVGRSDRVSAKRTTERGAVNAVAGTLRDDVSDEPDT
jgi:hypothetical protein